MTEPNITPQEFKRLKELVTARMIQILTEEQGYSLEEAIDRVYTSSVYDENAHYDQILLNSAAMDYVTRTNYMITKPTHILGLGMGYKWKSFYVDLAYKIRHQKADFYAFDDAFTSPNSNFSQANPDLANTYLAPVPVDLTRHSITCTLGFKF